MTVAATAGRRRPGTATTDQYADHLAELMDQLDLRDVVMVGHSTGGGEVTRYLGRHGTDRVAKAVLLGAIPPGDAAERHQTPGTPIEAFDGLRAGVDGDRSQFYLNLAVPFSGANRDGAHVSEGAELVLDVVDAGPQEGRPTTA